MLSLVLIAELMADGFKLSLTSSVPLDLGRARLPVCPLVASAVVLHPGSADDSRSWSHSSFVSLSSCWVNCCSLVLILVQMFARSFCGSFLWVLLCNPPSTLLIIQSLVLLFVSILPQMLVLLRISSSCTVHRSPTSVQTFSPYVDAFTSQQLLRHHGYAPGFLITTPKPPNDLVRKWWPTF